MPRDGSFSQALSHKLYFHHFRYFFHFTLDSALKYSFEKRWSFTSEKLVTSAYLSCNEIYYVHWLRYTSGGQQRQQRSVQSSDISTLERERVCVCVPTVWHLSRVK